jgi:hypothetical protein
VARYLSQLDTADRREPSEALAHKTKRLKERLVKLRSEMQRVVEIEKQMLASPGQQISLTDPDSRSMATSGRGSGVVGYNVQVAVDTEHHLIVTHEVTNVGSDCSRLASVGGRRRQFCRLIGSMPLPTAVTSTLRQSGMRSGRHRGDAAEAADVQCEVGRPLW